MDEKEQKRKHANYLRTQKNYPEALVIFQELCVDTLSDETKWDYWGLSYCLLRLRRYDECMDICRQLYNMYPDFETGNNNYGWALYYKHIKVEQPVLSDALQAGEEIIRYTNPKNKFTPYHSTVFKLLEMLKKEGSNEAETFFEWIEKVHPKELDDTIQKNNDEAGFPPTSTLREKYYMLKTSALLEFGLFEECLQSCDIAIRMTEKPMYNQSYWFKRQKALVYKEMKNYDKALSIMHDIIRVKKDWRAFYDFAEMLYEVGDSESALLYSLQSALRDRNGDLRQELYMLLYELLMEKGMEQEAADHLFLIKDMRETLGLEPDEGVLNLLTKLENSITAKPIIEIQEDLANLWKELLFESPENQHGAVLRILPNGHSGFVKSDLGGSYYFQMSEYLGNRRAIREGLRVKFILEEGYDFKKDQDVKVATFIRPVEKEIF